MKQLFSLTLLLAVISYCYSGCCNCKDTITTTLLPYKVDISSGGGFSEMHSGFTISPSGIVSYWTRIQDRKEDVQKVGTLSAEQLISIQKHIDDSAFRTFAYNETGNMTTTLRITSDNELHSFSWAGTRSEVEHVPPQLLKLYTYLNAILEPIIIDMNKKDTLK